MAKTHIDLTIEEQVLADQEAVVLENQAWREAHATRWGLRYSAGEREALTQMYESGLDLNEICAAMGRSYGSVRVQLARLQARRG